MRLLTATLIAALCCAPAAPLLAGPGSISMVIRAPAAAASSCPSWGTYIAAWNGDYPSDTDMGCFLSGSLNGTLVGGTLSASYGDGSVGLHVAGTDQALAWAIADGDIPETDSTGITVYLKIRVGSDGTDAATNIFELEEDTDNVNSAYFQVMDTETVRFTWRANSVLDNVTSAGTITRDGTTWAIVGFSVIPGEATGANDMAVTVNGGTAWTEENDDPALMTVQQNYMVIGNYFITSGNDPIDIDSVVVLSGYKTAKPSGF